MRMFLARTTLRTVWQGCPFPLVLRRSKSNMNGLPKSEGEWRTVLSPQQFRVLRQKGTEMPGTGKYNKLFDPGVYHCGACNVPLYKSTTKFDSGCGWPAFFDAIPGAIDRHDDTSHGMRRTEITCHNCGSHLGHVFYDEGFNIPTNARHCVNSISLNFQPDESKEKREQDSDHQPASKNLITRLLHI